MNKRKLLSVLLVVMLFVLSGTTALADGVDGEKPYLALGADLSADEMATVLRELGLEGKDLSGYDIVYVTNADEHHYLGEYLSASVIGSRALSSVLVESAASGSGLSVTTKNISYCTVGMYRNALITAGIEDANITVAGPFSITGTAALVGAVKAYEVMTGEEIAEDSLETATNELVITGEVAESVGDSDTAEQLLALIKQLVIEQGLESEEDILDAVDQAADELNIELTDADRQKIASLMDKISDLDIDVDALKNQAKDLYDKLSDMDLMSDSEGIIAAIKSFFSGIIDFIASLFS